MGSQWRFQVLKMLDLVQKGGTPPQNLPLLALFIRSLMTFPTPSSGHLNKKYSGHFKNTFLVKFISFTKYHGQEKCFSF